MMKLFRAIETISDGNYNVGDVIAFALNDGEEVEALAVKQERNGMIFCLVDCLIKEESMGYVYSNWDGYESCALREALNTKILSRFPSEIREKMVAFETGDLLRLPTEREIFGRNIYGKEESNDVEQWKPMKDCRHRIAFRGSKTAAREWYWLQNLVFDSASGFALVSGGGNADYSDASAPLGVRPIFKIQNLAL